MLKLFIMIVVYYCRISWLSSHPSVVKIGSHIRYSTVRGFPVSSPSFELQLLAGQKGCAAVELYVDSAPPAQAAAVKPAKQRPPAAQVELNWRYSHDRRRDDGGSAARGVFHVCVDSSILPLDAQIHLCPGGVIRPFIDPEYSSSSIYSSAKQADSPGLQDDEQQQQNRVKASSPLFSFSSDSAAARVLSVPLHVTLTAESIAWELTNTFHCSPIVKHKFDSCMLWDITQTNQVPPVVLRECQLKDPAIQPLLTSPTAAELMGVLQSNVKIGRAHV